MPKKIAKGFTLIELLVVLAIISILSGAGVVVYNSHASTAKDSATKINHTKMNIIQGLSKICRAP